MGIILLPAGGVNKLASDFKVTRQSVSRALRGHNKSSLANMLRKAALERGGRLHKDVTDYIPNCETSFETSDNLMVQTFGERVRVVFDLTTGDGEIYVDDVSKAIYCDVSITTITEVQKEAQRLTDELIKTNN